MQNVRHRSTFWNAMHSTYIDTFLAAVVVPTLHTHTHTRAFCVSVIMERKSKTNSDPKECIRFVTLRNGTHIDVDWNSHKICFMAFRLPVTEFSSFVIWILMILEWKMEMEKVLLFDQVYGTDRVGRKLLELMWPNTILSNYHEHWIHCSTINSLRLFRWTADYTDAQRITEWQTIKILV